MIKIFNKKQKVEILIDEKSSLIQFSPYDYEEKPYVIIEIKDFNLIRHVTKCDDCNKFFNSFGKNSTNWYISYSDKIFRLDMKELGKNNYLNSKISLTHSEYNSGTKLTLLFHELPIRKKELERLLIVSVEQEDYEQASIIRDLINDQMLHNLF